MSVKLPWKSIRAKSQNGDRTTHFHHGLIIIIYTRIENQRVHLEVADAPTPREHEICTTIHDRGTMSGRGIEETTPDTADPEIVDWLHVGTSVGAALAGLLTGYSAAQAWLAPTAFGLLVMAILIAVVSIAWLYERDLVRRAGA